MGHRIVTLPNAVTLARLLTLPLVPWLLLVEDRRTAAAVVLGVLGTTDWVDGWIARRFGQVSEFGATFDPVVDRLLFLVGAISVLLDQSLPSWFLFAVVGREVFVGGMMVIGTALGMARFQVSTWGKRYTFLLMIALPLMLLGVDEGRWTTAFMAIGWILGSLGLVTGWVVGLGYVNKVRAAVREARANRTVR